MQRVLLSLLDISQPLLTEAVNHARSVFDGNPRVTTWGIQGDMYHLPSFYPLLPKNAAQHHRRVGMFVDILHKLPNESLFIENSLRPFESGDLLFVLVNGVYASTAETDKIHESDPRLNGSIPKSWDERINQLLTGPFVRHYGRRLQDIQLTPKLDISPNCLPNSYAINMIADLTMAGGHAKQFNVQRFVRYDANSVIDLFARSKWDVVDAWQHGRKNDYLLFLFRKR